MDWGGLINACLDANHEAIWRAAGSLLLEGRRYIPSVVLVHRFRNGATASGGWRRAYTVGGRTIEYEIGRSTHVSYADTPWLNWRTPPIAALGSISVDGVPADRVRDFGHPLAHEYSHNFLDFGDLYGSAGCTGYWDLLGDNSPAGRMSEVSAVHKARIGWLTFRQVIQGPSVPARALALRPYTEFGDAIKVVPDPEHTPTEYFVLEYRKSTGKELWRPDRALSEGGLLITHMNERIALPPTDLSRESPYFDPEFADGSDRGAALWTGHDRLSGVLYPQGERNAFTPETMPSSDFYGRASGLRITNIRATPDQVTFRLAINCRTQVGWTVSDRDRCVAGRFTEGSRTMGQDVFCRNDGSAALLRHREGQWLVGGRHDGRIAGWALGPDNREVVGDLDGDGLDEIYIRSPEWAGVLKWAGTGFRAVNIQHDWIDGWNLGGDNRELAADLNGDGRAEIYIRSPEWAGVLSLVDERLALQSIQHDWIDGWNLGPQDREWVGRFTERGRDEMLIRTHEWLGLLVWDVSRRGLRLQSIQHDWIDEWNLGAKDKHVVGDFDGDGLDEIYLRSPQWAGVLKWAAGRFRLLWIRRGDVRQRDGGAPVPLAAGDRSYAGKFLPTREGILHRMGGAVAILTWEAGEMRVRYSMQSPFHGRWHLGAGDRFVLGDFHRVGMDVADPANDFVTDDLTDVFVHNAWGTAMFGVNYWQNPRDPRQESHQIGLTWVNRAEILKGDPIRLAEVVKRPFAELADTLLRKAVGVTGATDDVKVAEDATVLPPAAKPLVETGAVDTAAPKEPPEKS